MSGYRVGRTIYESEKGDSVRLVHYEGEKKRYVVKFIGPLDNDLKKIIFNREINALKKLNKYNDIVKIYHHETGAKINGKTNMGAILLEYAGDKTLEDINFYELSELKKYDICLKILKAVSNAHSNGIIHRDIKPSNIMYTDQGIKIIDFGSSKIKSVVESETMLPMSSTGYSAPELVLGKETTEISDIYSIGAVFFRIFTGKEPKSKEQIAKAVEDLSINKDVRNIILSMLEEDLDCRLNDINIAINTFEDTIGNLNTMLYQFYFRVDSHKLTDLKNNFIVRSDMTMNQFLHIYLKDEFEKLYGHYNEKNNLYEFIGNCLYMECLYKVDTNLFQVTKMYKIDIDKKKRRQKKYLKIYGKKKFINSFTSDKLIDNYNNSLQLTNMIQNHDENIKSLDSKNKKFNELFQQWRISLDESIESEKIKNGKIVFDSYNIKDDKIILKVKEYKNRSSYDNLDSDIRYLIELQENGKLRTESIGSYEDVVFDDSGVEIIINIDNLKSLSKIKKALDSQNQIEEDYNYKIKSYTKQIRAINSLYNEEYNSRNLKDIILDIEEPQYIKSLKNLSLHEKGLNQSQKDAVKKVSESECISLIQGPPGTGKTKVIKEILSQIVNTGDKNLSIPKILIVSQSHTAVDNILEDLDEIDKKPDIKIIRIGAKKNIAKEIFDKYTVESIRKNIYDQVKENSNLYMKNKQIEYNSKGYLDEDEKINWQKIKDIQMDWIKRCADYESLDYQLINSATIIAGTCIGFLSNEFVREMEFDYVIVDEAAKATSPELLVSIIKAKKIILVGDQNQLPPFNDQESSPTAKTLANPKFRLFDILFDILPESHKQVLTKQYRMIRNIGDLISTVFYDGLLETGVEDEKRRHGIERFGNKSIIWYNTSGLKSRNQDKQNGTYINLTENKIIKDILIDLHKSSNAENLDIGVITGYRGQKNLISKTISNIDFNKFHKPIDVNTLDAFQGRENDIIIYSTVRTQNSIGFQHEKERINVAFSRAKTLLIICGDLDFFYNWDEKENKYVEIINYIKKNKEECEIINLEEGDIIG
ncbi:protein kinase [Clostridioides sp. ZZV15-6383]|uniref:AAA domain-containing protein n=1 Tax=Clostridioides sp. ZZV15-6383 TaxID=2811498 RepID=UPI001D10C5B6|nr:protein kinase [Clostridioides sp. ZZV15-6383]